MQWRVRLFQSTSWPLTTTTSKSVPWCSFCPCYAGPWSLSTVELVFDIDRKSGEPTSDPAATYQCNRFSEPRCAFSTRADMPIVDGLPSATATAPLHRRVLHWFVPPNQQSLGQSPNSGASGSGPVEDLRMIVSGFTCIVPTNIKKKH